MISIKYGIDIIRYFSHLVRAHESRNTQFINSAEKLEKLPEFVDNSYLARG